MRAFFWIICSGLVSCGSIAAESNHAPESPRLFRCIEVAGSTLIESEIINRKLVEAFVSAVESSKTIPAKYASFEDTEESWFISNASPRKSLLIYFPNFTIPSTFWMFEAVVEKTKVRGKLQKRVQIEKRLQEPRTGKETTDHMIETLKKLKKQR